MKNLGKVIKSLSDKRTYRAFSLANDLQCIVISDKDALKSAASLSVGVGALQDPIDAQGLAHYLEHMLFMGTAKYPQENEYSSFLAKNAGSSNAYTDQMETNYYFQVAHAALFDTLDRFSQFFIAPLMKQSSSEKELNAVHSEHSKNLQNDSWRKFQITKSLAKPNHPYSKFSTGDKTTLSNPNLTEMLHNFYNSCYSANLMKLVVYGQQDIDILTEAVQKKFEGVINKSYKKYEMTQPPYGKEELDKFVKIVPIKDKKTLELTWILPNKAQYYRFSPGKYVSHILGHQGKGSLLSFLISQGLGTSLSAGASDAYECYSQFQITIQLTQSGLKRIPDIIGYIFHSIQMLKESKPQQWIIEEIQKINKIKFDFLEKKQGMNYASSIAKNMHKKSAEDILIFPYLMEEFRPDLIDQYLKELKSQNLLVIVESKTFEAECNQTEPIYGSKYLKTQLGEVKALPCNVALPQKNLFIPQNLQVLPIQNETIPTFLFKSPIIEAYFKGDHQFQLPKAQINLRFYFDGHNTIKEQISRTLLEKMLTQSLREFTYMAEMADLDSKATFGSYFTMNINITGFRDSFSKFTIPYLLKILQFIPSDLPLFLNLKAKQQRQYSNYFLNNPYQLAYTSISSALRDGSSTCPRLRLKQIENLTLQDVIEYGKKWKKQLFAEILISGNLQQSHANTIAQEVQKILKEKSSELPKSQIGLIRPVFLPVGRTCAVEQPLMSQQQKNASLIVHYQYEQLKLRTKLLQDLALAFVKEPAFDYLRTKEQLGYIVMCLPDDHRGVMGMSILVQSSVKNSYELGQYVDKFVNDILVKKIEELDQKTFEEYKAALLSTKIQKDKNLSAQSTRFWTQIVKHSFQFKRKQQEIQAIPSITLTEFKNFLKGLFHENKRIFELHQVPQNQAQATAAMRKQRLQSDPSFSYFADVQSFRKKMQLYPDYYSHL